MTSNMRKIVFFVIMLSVALVAYQYMIKPANEHLARTKDDLKQDVDRLNEFKEATEADKGIAEQFAQLQEAILFFESKLPPTSEIHKVLKNITVIAQKQGLRPKTIKTLKMKDNSGYIEQPLQMELVGNFNSFYSFLLELEKLPRIMKIRELDLEKSKNLEGQVTADIVLSIFFQNQTG